MIAGDRPEVSPCPRCGAPLPSEGWQGLCPKCLVRVSLDVAAEERRAGERLGPAAVLGGTKGRPKDAPPCEPTAPPGPADVLLERIGMVIGRYKLLQQIGEGGFGVVFMAEQTEPVQRKVALKIIKAGMETREIIARFEAERQALALMDHPNIAKVLDAGATASGRPYFAMELVRGVPLTDYCDHAKLSTRERLELFIKVCRAVQHAHQKGVIHRDLKPSNVLVTLHDGEPVPKVIDFGIAKALGQKLTDKTVFTRFEQMIGTPAYMSPEQAALGGLDIDTRSDIYSLGVLLYELLTGVTPLDQETLRQGALDEIRRMIRETDPPKPSTRLLSLGDRLGEVARCRHAEAASLGRLIRGDLDWITMKALEKDRRRRYETVNGLVMDVERHLKNEPVLARPPSAVYRFQKVARRHRVAFTLGAVIGLCFVLGLVTSTWQAVRATRAERQARLQSEENQAIMEILEQTLARTDPTGESIRQSLLDSVTQWLHRERPGEQRKVADFVRRMQENMLNFRRAPSQQAVTNVELSFLAASNNAWVAFQQTNYSRAIAQAQQALALSPKDAQFQQLIADARSQLSKRNPQSLQSLNGFLFVASADLVEKRGAPGIRGIVVRGPDFLKDKNLENQLALCLGKPITELELLRAQKTVVDWCRRAGHPLVDIVIPEQDIVDGVLQVAVIEGQINFARFSPDGSSIVTVSGSNARIWDVRTGLPLTNPVRSLHPSPDGKRILPAEGEPVPP